MAATSHRILIIDDDPDGRLMIQTRLEANGFIVSAAADGEEGLSLAHAQHPDVILLDVVIPKISGLEVCRRLKNDPDTKGVPVVVITAATFDDLEQRIRDAGADAWVRRPCTSVELLKVIKGAISHAH